MASKLNEAIDIAVRLHKGQTDKAGKPYIEHCLRVMASGLSEKEKVVAMLHDVLEDTHMLAVDLRELHYISEEVVESVVCLTKVNGEDYQQYLNRVKLNKMARNVKIADLKDNMDTSRYGHLKLTPADVAKIRNRCDKYAKALKFLTSD